MSKNFRKMLSYYKSYQGIFWADIFFATVSAGIALLLPLVIRYVTSTLIYLEPAEIMYQVKIIAVLLFALVALDCYSKFFISNYGHVMGAKIEYDMRAEIFDHLQKLSFSYYDNQKVGQLMSRITTDLFDITELMHHGPENIILSVIKIIGAFVILFGISPKLALAAFAVLPVMFGFAYYMNKKMRNAFRQNRIKIAEINAQIEDNLSGIRVVKSFANEDIENHKFRQGNEGFLCAKKKQLSLYGKFFRRTRCLYNVDPGQRHSCGRRADCKKQSECERSGDIFAVYQCLHGTGAYADRFYRAVPERLHRF